MAGRVLEAASPQELKAVALPLTDLSGTAIGAKQRPGADVFLDIDDRQFDGGQILVSDLVLFAGLKPICKETL